MCDELNPLSARIGSNCGQDADDHHMLRGDRHGICPIPRPERRPGPSFGRARAFTWAAWTVSRILSAAEAACNHFSGPSVAGRLLRATRPGTRGHGRRTEVRQELLALARDGVCRALPVTGKAVRSYRTVSPLPRTPGGAVRRFALCCTVPRARPRARVAVSHHRVQSCPDFPPHLDRGAAAACPRSHRSGAAQKRRIDPSGSDRCAEIRWRSSVGADRRAVRPP